MIPPPPSLKVIRTFLSSYHSMFSHLALYPCLQVPHLILGSSPDLTHTWQEAPDARGGCGVQSTEPGPCLLLEIPNLSSPWLYLPRALVIQCRSLGTCPCLPSKMSFKQFILLKRILTSQSNPVLVASLFGIAKLLFVFSALPVLSHLHSTNFPVFLPISTRNITCHKVKGKFLLKPILPVYLQVCLRHVS